MPGNLTHLERLEAESIHIMREVVAEAEQPGDALFGRQGQRGDAAPGAQGVLSRRRRRSRCSTSTRPGSSRTCTSCATGWRARAGMELLVYHNPEADGARDQPVRPRPAAHRHVEDRRAEAGARQVRLRRGLRRRAARRGEEPRQGAHLLASAPPAIAGTRRTSGPSCGTSTTRARAKGESIRVFPISNWTELDIWQYIHLKDIADRAALLRRAAPDGGARRPAADGRRRALSAAARRGAGRCARSASARSAAIR